MQIGLGALLKQRRNDVRIGIIVPGSGFWGRFAKHSNKAAPLGARCIEGTAILDHRSDDEAHGVGAWRQRGFEILTIIRAVLAFGAMAAIASPALSQDIVYEPINPSFGGNPFNSGHLLGIANAQNDFRDPRATTGSGSQADIFARQLQSRLLSALSSQIVDAIFGENPQESGTISFGGQTITFNRSLTDVTLNITNDETGEVTTIVIPTFIEVN